MTYRPDPESSRPPETEASVLQRHAPTTAWRVHIAQAWRRGVIAVSPVIVAIYVGSVWLAGFEALSDLGLPLGVVWPITIPFMIGTLAFVYLFRERLRAHWRRLRHQ